MVDSEMSLRMFGITMRETKLMKKTKSTTGSVFFLIHSLFYDLTGKCRICSTPVVRNKVLT